MKYKAISFDLMGTLVICDDYAAQLEEWMEEMRRILITFGLTCQQQSFNERALHHFSSESLPPSSLNSRLTIYERRLLGLCQDFGINVSLDDLQEIILGLTAVWYRHFSMAHDCEKVLRRLSEEFVLHLVTNYDHPPFIHQLLKKLGIRVFFNSIVISGECGCQKPDPRIFESILRVFSAEDIIHVGDSDDDVKGALAAGIRPILLRRPAEIKESPRVFTAPKVSAMENVTVIRSLSELIPLLMEAA